MRTIPIALAPRIKRQVTTLAMLWRITLRDGTLHAFTSLDSAIRVSAILYKSAAGMEPSAIASSSGMEVDNVDISGLLGYIAADEEALILREWSGADVEVALIDWANPAAGEVIMRSGFLGEIKIDFGRRFTAEVRGLGQILQQPVGQKYSKTCRTSFGEPRCGLNAAAYTATGAITSLGSGTGRDFHDTSRIEPAEYFRYGMLVFTGGLNAGAEIEVAMNSVLTRTVVLMATPVFPLSVGDTYTITRGCSRTLAACQALGNVINFRAEPHIPNSGVSTAYGNGTG